MQKLGIVPGTGGGRRFKVSEKLKWFEAALTEYLPEATMTDLAASLGREPALFRTYLETGQGLSAFAENVLTGLLGCSTAEFIEKGRLLTAPEETARPAAGPGSEVDGLLAKARAILEAGDERAAALRILIRLMRPES